MGNGEDHPLGRTAAPAGDFPVIKVVWLTYQDPRGDSLKGFGRVWDQFPRFAPDVVDDRDPPRARYDSVEQAMGELAESLVPGRLSSTWMYRFEPGSKGRDRPIELSVAVGASCRRHRIELAAGERGEDLVYPQFPAEISALVKPPMLAEAEAREDLYELFKALAQQLEAYHAVITPLPLTNQFRNRGFPYLFLRDVGWVNWFGPSVLARWGGPDALAEVGVFQERVGESLVVWATEAPPVRDDTLTGIASYPWKWPFYDAVGRESWWKADPDKKDLSWVDQMALVGVHAPSPEEHRMHARQWEGDS
jgi:hypothetical protein